MFKIDFKATRPFFLLCLFIALIGSSPAKALEYWSRDPKPGQSFQANDYVMANWRNTLELYFKYDVYGTNNTAAVDTYIHVHECDLYKEFYENDLDWIKIRDSYKEVIQKREQNAPVKFIVPVDVTIERYNKALEAFPLEEKSQMKNVGLLELISRSDYTRRCLMPYVPEAPFYESIYIKTYRPHYLLDVPASPEEAEIIINTQARLFQEDEDREERRVRLLFYVSVDGFSEFDSYDNIPYFYGRVDALQVLPSPQSEDPLITLYPR